eukprot:SAG31_NODE_933_length_10897_cov_15.489442_10_plen_96_part_00
MAMDEQRQELVKEKLSADKQGLIKVQHKHQGVVQLQRSCEDLSRRLVSLGNFERRRFDDGVMRAWQVVLKVLHIGRRAATKLFMRAAARGAGFRS